MLLEVFQPALMSWEPRRTFAKGSVAQEQLLRSPTGSNQSFPTEVRARRSPTAGNEYHVPDGSFCG